jgi:hypothetical protein
MATDDGAPRITQQYRDRDGRMVYELRHGTSQLVLVANEQVTGNEWRFEAHSRETPDLVVTGAWSSSRATAFKTMRELCVERGEALASIDWDKVAAALVLVRAI